MNPMTLSGVPRLNWQGGNVALAFDGNSLLSGGEVATGTVALAPISGAITAGNVGIFGQTIQDMIDSAADVNALWVNGKTNVLVVWEGFNSMRLGRTALQAITDMQAYVAARHAVHPAWKILAITSQYTSASTWNNGNMDYANGQIDVWNSQLRQNYRSMGLAGIVDIVTPGSPFALASFPTAQQITNTGLYADAIHLNPTGYAVVAQYVASALRRLPAR